MNKEVKAIIDINKLTKMMLDIKEDNCDFYKIQIENLMCQIKVYVTNLQRENEQLQQKVNQLETNRADAIYLKVNEATQEKGCIEDKELAKMAQELVGKKVKVTYGTRIGLYSTGSCHTAPIEKIELIEE